MDQMDQNEDLEPGTTLPEPGADGTLAAPAETTETAETPEAAEAPAGTTDGEPDGDGIGAAARPREVIRGIHPELLCTCEECEPDHVELQWFSVDEQRKVKGTAMLFCARSSRKYFTPVADLQAFLTANPAKGRKG